MTRNYKEPVSRRFTPSEAPTVKRTTVSDDLAHLYEIQNEVEQAIKSIEGNPHDSDLRIRVINSLDRIKTLIRQFEEYLGLY